MRFQDTGRASMRRTDQSQSFVGEIVEVRLDGGLHHRGVVNEPIAAETLKRIPARAGDAA
ncbi:uncharacterized protein YijF (DUF1287 family) [Arthrobacter sp. BE255]|nr:uncharacterized protein YijF (DUF1287 family) [Arthrobacter sp. BE255]